MKMTKGLSRCLAVAALTIAATAALASTTVGSLEPAQGTWRVFRGTGFATAVCTGKSEAEAKACAAADAEGRAASTRYQIRYPDRYVTVTYVQPTCPAQPAAQTRTQSCPTGTTGSWSQTLAYTSVAYPTCWTSDWTPASAPAGACVTDPVTPPPVVTPPVTPPAAGSPVVNGLLTVKDPFAHMPIHSVAATAGALPVALATPALPSVPTVRILNRRDAALLYFGSVEGATDYRAYVVDNDVSFVDSANGKQPRGAVIACAGYRQHGFESAVVNGQHTREVLQSVELPGVPVSGEYTIVLEATSTPCPFTGIPGHTDATITQFNRHNADPGSYPSTGQHYAKFASFSSVLAAYGNEYVNGQGAVSNWVNRLTSTMGLQVPPDSTEIPKDPVVLARSAIAVLSPALEEPLLAPVIDVGSNAIEENFTENLVVNPATYVANPDYSGADIPGAPKFEIPGAWQFWGRYLQPADGQSGVVNGAWSPKGMLGLQVFQRHGRLYTSFGDGGQDVGGAIGFASSKVAPQQLDSTKYVHSMFRINSEATQRRYWTWSLCGAQTPEELQDPTTHAYKIRPIFNESAFATALPTQGLYADNPSMPNPRLGTLSVAGAQNVKAKECLSIAEDGQPEYPVTTRVRTSGVIRAQIHPLGYAKGIIPLGNNVTDNGNSPKGFRFKVDSSGKYAGPMIEPFDQLAPLTHYDVFVRPDRVVFFVNGRQGFCVDLTDRPLTMKYGMVTYGDLLYHSSLEWEGIASPQRDGLPMRASQLYHTVLNSPIATSRAWDVIGEADKVDIPAQFPTFDASQCVKPASWSVQ